MQWEAVSNIGSRETNEDHVRVIEHGSLTCFVLADGLGGHGKGDVASFLAGQAFEDVCTHMTGTLEELLRAGFTLAQKALLEEQAKAGDFFQTKTTLCALLVQDNSLMWGHIGDSRLYAFSRNKIKVHTLDHSVPQMLVLSRDIKEKDIRNHPDRNRLLRVLGMAGDTPQFTLSDVYPVDAFQGFLLCSDGFWELIVEKEMCAALKKSNNASQWSEKMNQLVAMRGDENMDNYSSITVQMQ